MTDRSLTDWLVHAEQTHPSEIDMGLARVQQVAQRMGLPATDHTRYIIVAGTNGKGSTTLAMEALLLAQGFTVGATLSPHVHLFNERVRVNGSEVDDQTLSLAFADVDRARAEIPLTYFEFAALVALQIFRNTRVQFAILEVGLGGRLDAFNIVDAEVAVVTSISLDHQAYLGDDVQQIGREKAGVFRPGQVVVLGDVTDSVRQCAQELQCATAELGQDFSISESARNWNYAAADCHYSELPQGPLAACNWALAITVVAGIEPLNSTQIQQAIRSTRLPGRMEAWQLEGREVLLDVAHNPAAAQLLQQRLRLLAGPRHLVGILGMLRDKDPAGVVAELAESVQQWVLVRTEGPRGMGSAQLKQCLHTLPSAITIETIDAAFSAALSLTQQGDGILVLGSFAVVEQSRNWLHESTTLAAIGLEQG